MSSQSAKLGPIDKRCYPDPDDADPANPFTKRRKLTRDHNILNRWRRERTLRRSERLSLILIQPEVPSLGELDPQFVKDVTHPSLLARWRAQYSREQSQRHPYISSSYPFAPSLNGAHIHVPVQAIDSVSDNHVVAVGQSI